MFESLVAFGVPATVTASALLKALASLREAKLVVGYVPRAKVKPRVRWFTLVGSSRRSSEELVIALVTKLESLTVVSVIEHGGAVAVLHHELADDAVTTTHETFAEEGTQKSILGRALTKLHGKGTLDELVAAASAWTYVKTTTGAAVDSAVVERDLTWAIETYEASDIAFLPDEDDDGDVVEASTEAAAIVEETAAERDRRKARVSALFSDPDQLEQALAACRECRSQGDFTWYSAEHYALESRGRWKELFEFARDTVTYAKQTDCYGQSVTALHRSGHETLQTAAKLLEKGLHDEAAALVRLVRARFPNAFERFPALRKLR